MNKIIFLGIIGLVSVISVLSANAVQTYQTPFQLCVGTTRYAGIVEQAPYIGDANCKPVRTLGVGTAEPRAGLTLDQNFPDTNANFAVGRAYDKSYCQWDFVNSTNYTGIGTIKYTLCEMKGQLQLNMYDNGVVKPVFVITPNGDFAIYSNPSKLYVISQEGTWVNIQAHNDGSVKAVIQEPHWSSCVTKC